jgi:2-polyprenyl-6-hydroxyphenyl methylase/3-demethylubiquinone-9 3-methyltransferase
MNRVQFRRHKQQFVSAFRAVLAERGKNVELTEAAFCAYSDLNPLIRFLFWRRVWVAINFLEMAGSHEAVLDFGCGSGVVMPLLAAFSNRVVGLDTNLAPYRALCDHISFPNSVEMYETQEYSLSRFPDKTFDVILALDVLEHVSNLKDVLSEFCRVSKPGSIVIVCGPTENLFYRIGRKIAGKEYTGDYHVTNIYKIQKVMKTFMETKTLATLYYPFPLFKIIRGVP